MKIGIAFDLAPAASASPPGGPDDRFEEFDKPETVEAIARAIRDDGHDVTLLGDGRDFLARVLADPPDFVFNIAEGEGVGRCREARVPAALELLGIPYSGSDPLALAASLDKGIARILVAGSGRPVAVPVGGVFPPEYADAPGMIRDCVRQIRARIGDRVATQPSLILKPAFEGSSKGVRDRCLVDEEDEAISIFNELAENYGQPILIEEFIVGDEITCGIVGNLGVESSLYFRGVMRIIPNRPSDRFVYSLEVKRDWINQVTYEAPARQSWQETAELGEAIDAVCSILGLRDVARIDFRVRDGVPYFIEANPLPGLAAGVGDLIIMAQGYGIDHARLIRGILDAGLARAGLP